MDCAAEEVVYTRRAKLESRPDQATALFARARSSAGGADVLRRGRDLDLRRAEDVAHRTRRGRSGNRQCHSGWTSGNGPARRGSPAALAPKSPHPGCGSRANRISRRARPDAARVDAGGRWRVHAVAADVCAKAVSVLRFTRTQDDLRRLGGRGAASSGALECGGGARRRVGRAAPGDVRHVAAHADASAGHRHRRVRVDRGAMRQHDDSISRAR